MSTAAPLGRPSINDQIVKLSRRLVAGPIKLDETTDAEDRVLARMEQLDLVELGTSTARLTEKGRKLAAGGGAAPTAVAAPPAAGAKSKRAPSAPVVADPSALTWEDPPAARASGHGRSHWFEPFVAILQSRPNKWARIATLDDRKLATMRASSVRGYAKKHRLAIEACARVDEGGGGSVFARFIGKAGK